MAFDFLPSVLKNDNGSHDNRRFIRLDREEDLA